MTDRIKAEIDRSVKRAARKQRGRKRARSRTATTFAKVESSFGPGDHVGYAVFDVSSSGFIRADDMFGGVVFEDRETAEEIAESGQFVLRLEVESLG